VHLDELSQITDDTLERRKQYIPKANQIIDEVKFEFLKWLETRKFAPVINALKQKLKTMKEEEMDFHAKKLIDFNQEQADLVSERIIQKITKQFANHLKNPEIDTQDSLELIQRVFQLEIKSK
ncbi:MAG: glutamyl-tRNA reductase, partial [Croceitalea sp.]|nr:glutamyl-tRNA reductase [Croceitalea sp.]